MNTPNASPRRRVAVVGAGPGGISAAIAFHQAGHEVRLFERMPRVTPLGGAVLLSLPVLAILRGYGVDIDRLGAMAVTEFRDWKGRLRVRLPFNPLAEEKAKLRGWHYGMLRAEAIDRMLQVLPAELLHPNHCCTGFEERADGVRVLFEDGGDWDADLLVGADGIRSAVSRQVFGDPGLFHCGIVVWLAWCHAEGVPRDVAYISHSRKVQASYFPILHQGQPAFEWWVVEPWTEGRPPPADARAHVAGLIEGWCDPIPKLFAATDFQSNAFRWEIYNRAPLANWSRGRVSFVGDAVHPVSPYAAYGMGMAVEDGFWLAKSLRGVDLGDAGQLADGLARCEAQRVNYTNHHAILARRMGRLFHRMPWPLSALRDGVLNHTSFLERVLVRDYLRDAEDQMIALEV